MSSNDILDMYIYETNSLLEQLETIVSVSYTHLTLPTICSV